MGWLRRVSNRRADEEGRTEKKLTDPHYTMNLLNSTADCPHAFIFIQASFLTA